MTVGASRSHERLVLDTHVWKRYVDGEGLATKTSKRIDLARNHGTLFVAAITVWEMAILPAQGKIRLNGPTLAWVSEAVAQSRAVVYPLEPAISVDAVELAVFHGDPADRMIVATARHLSAVLVTRDSRILDWAEETK